MASSSANAEIRNRAIEILLLWEGAVSSSRLRELFAVHRTLASRDIAAFRAEFPQACTPAFSGASYVVSPLLRPKLSRGDFLEYQLLIGAGVQPDQLRAGVPSVCTRVDVTEISYTLFRPIHQAIREGECISIQYRSMSTPDPHQRLIRPHAFIQAGPRWHVRAWCSTARAFRDFNLGRIASVAPAVDASSPPPEADLDWQTEVAVRFVPHADLSPGQKALVRAEFMGGTTALVCTVRVPIVRYLVRAFGAAIDPEKERPPAHLLMVEQPEMLPVAALWWSP